MCFLCDLKTSSAPAPQRGPWQARRAFVLAGVATAALPAAAQVDVGKASSMRKLVPADQIEKAGSQQFVQTVQEAKQKNALVPANHPQTQRLHAIAKRIIPFAAAWNPRAKDWQWQVALINSDQINAFCLPGGKIAFYTGILSQLKLTDDEAAMIMGHEMAHALREHARERIAKTQATGLGLSVAASLFGLGQLGELGANIGTQLLSLKYSRDDETEADLVGLEVAARGAYDPDASVSLWNKMMAASKRQGGTSFLSSHPSGPDRIRQLQANIPRVEGLYRQAQRTQPAASPALARQPVGTPTGTPRYDTPIGRAIDAR